MLVLSRKPGESITIDGGIRITVVGVRGNKIKLAIDAPRDTTIMRDELIKEEKPSDPAFDVLLSADGYTLASF